MNFGHKYVHIPEHYLRDFDRLLMGGIWQQIYIRHQYDEEATGKRSPFWIDDLKPIQLGPPSIWTRTPGSAAANSPRRVDSGC